MSRPIAQQIDVHAKGENFEPLAGIERYVNLWYLQYLTTINDISQILLIENIARGSMVTQCYDILIKATQIRIHRTTIIYLNC